MPKKKTTKIKTTKTTDSLGLSQVSHPVPSTSEETSAPQEASTPNQTQEVPTEPAPEPEELTQNELIYKDYVHGKRPADIAEQYKLDSSEVLAIINDIERSKGK